MTLNICQVGHRFHDTKLAQTEYGPWYIWDWLQYQWQGAYCTGQDEVSKSIDLNGYWEKPDTDHMLGLLQDNPGTMLDFGSHIGWFALLAYKQGCQVACYDADPENMQLLRGNFQKVHDYEVYAGGRLSFSETWVADIPQSFIPVDPVRFIKVDLEGKETDALNLTRHLWQQGKVDFGLWELSPIFNDTYPALVDEIASYGYRWYILKGEERWYIEGKDLAEFPQENGWAVRADLD